MTQKRRTVAILVLVASALAIFSLRWNNVILRAQAGALRRKNEAAFGLSEENRRTRELLARAERDEGDVKKALHLELLRARSEARELEEQARGASARKVAEAAALEVSRDPEKGMTRLEYFRDVGRATPAAALQTFVRAALKGDERAVVSGLCVTGETREKIEAFIAGLPEAARAKYPVPESLAALVITGEILDVTAAQLVETTFVDAQHAIVKGRRADSDRETVVPMELFADGWKIAMPPKTLDALKKRMSNPPVETSPKK